MEPVCSKSLGVLLQAALAFSGGTSIVCGRFGDLGFCRSVGLRSALGVRGAARWTARARARNGARTDRLSQSGQFDELGLLCVSHYVAEAPQEFEALLDGPQVGGVRMARGRIASRQCGSRPKEALRCHRHGSVRLIYGAGGHHGRRVDGVEGLLWEAVCPCVKLTLRTCGPSGSASNA